MVKYGGIPGRFLADFGQRLRVHLGPVRTDLLSVDFRAVFWPLGAPDAICVKRRACLTEIGFGPIFELAESTRRRPLGDTGNADIRAT